MNAFGIMSLPGTSAEVGPEACKEAAAHASTLAGWALLIIGGSIVALLQTSYFRPERLAARLAYLLFVPGWFFLGRAIYWGTRVQQVYLASLFSKNPKLNQLRIAASADSMAQLWNLKLGLAIFGVWLVLFLGWWIFGQPPAKRGA